MNKVFESGLDTCSLYSQWLDLSIQKLSGQFPAWDFISGKSYRGWCAIGLILRCSNTIQSWIPESEVIRKRLDIPEDWNDFRENHDPGVQFADKIAAIIRMLPWSDLVSGRAKCKSANRL